MAARLWNHRCNHQCCVFCRPYLWSFICQGWFAALEHVQIAKSADGGHSGFKQQLFLLHSIVMMRQVPEQQMGTTAGVVNLAALIGMPVGQVIFFTIANLASAHVSWIVMAGLATGLFLVLIWMSTKILDPVFTDSDQYSQKA